MDVLWLQKKEGLDPYIFGQYDSYSHGIVEVLQ